MALRVTSTANEYLSHLCEKPVRGMVLFLDVYNQLDPKDQVYSVPDVMKVSTALPRQRPDDISEAISWLREMS